MMTIARKTIPLQQTAKPHIRNSNPPSPSHLSHKTMSQESSTMRVNPQRASHLLESLSSITTRISTVTSKNSITKPIRLVAVSKLKPATDILALYNPPKSPSQSHQPQLHFGENYLQELLEKSQLKELEGVRWHFIGALQSNKCVTLARDVQGLWAVESVDSVKKANLLQKGRKEHGGGEKLRVFVQVNTSGEDSKSGVDPTGDAVVELCRHVQEKCEDLKLQGLMTIGAIARSQATTAETENEDFVKLKEVRDAVARELGIEEKELELSMGMSEDFEGAIALGSDEVRVGSTIFGQRPPKSEAKVLESTEESQG